MSLAGSENLGSDLDRIQERGLLVGGAALVVCVALGLLPATQSLVLPAYLVAYLFWIGITVGSVGVVMLHHLTGGGWGAIVRRPAEAGGLTILLMAILFLPILAGSRVLYPWTDTAHMDELLRHKAPYLNMPFFVIRAVIFFTLMTGFAMILSRWSESQDQTSDLSPTRRLRAISGPGLVLVFVAATFMVIDWSMSREPYWYSSLYSPMILLGWALETFAFVVIVLWFLTRAEPMRTAATPNRIHDLGNLLLALVMVWAYLSIMQYIIMWSGNLTEEIPWYVRRNRGGWQFVGGILMIFHFFLPFFILLFRDVKRSVTTLAPVAAFLLLIHLLDLVWLVIPATNSLTEPYFAWGAVLIVPVAFVAIGGLWVWFFLRILRSKGLLPIHDPGIPVLAHAGGH